MQLELTSVMHNQVCLSVGRQLKFLHVPADAVAGLTLIRAADGWGGKAVVVARSDRHPDGLSAAPVQETPTAAHFTASRYNLLTHKRF